MNYETILIGFVVAVVTVVITRWVTQSMQKKEIGDYFKAFSAAGVKDVSAAKDSATVERHSNIADAIGAHMQSCNIRKNELTMEKDIDAIRRALIYLVTKEGGHPKDLGLL